MRADAVTASRSRVLALNSGAGLCLAALLAAMTFNVFGNPVSLYFVPIIILFLWPSNADISLSYLLIFIGGLIMDLMTGSLLGGWSLFFLLMFMFMQMFKPNREIGFTESWFLFLLWFGAFLLVQINLDVLGVLSVNNMDLFIAGIVNLILFPFVFYLRYRLRGYLVSEDD